MPKICKRYVILILAIVFFAQSVFNFYQNKGSFEELIDIESFRKSIYNGTENNGNGVEMENLPLDDQRIITVHETVVDEDIPVDILDSNGKDLDLGEEINQTIDYNSTTDLEIQYPNKNQNEAVTPPEIDASKEEISKRAPYLFDATWLNNRLHYYESYDRQMESFLNSDEAQSTDSQFEAKLRSSKIFHLQPIERLPNYTHPNIIHIVKLFYGSKGSEINLAYLNAVSIEIAASELKPEKIFFHSEVKPRGEFWKHLEESVPVLEWKQLDMKNKTIGDNYVLKASDMVILKKLEILEKYGGLIIDMNVIVANSSRLRLLQGYGECVLTEDSPSSISYSFISCVKNSSFARNLRTAFENEYSFNPLFNKEDLPKTILQSDKSHTILFDTSISLGRAKKVLTHLADTIFIESFGNWTQRSAILHEELNIVRSPNYFSDENFLFQHPDSPLKMIIRSKVSHFGPYESLAGTREVLRQFDKETAEGENKAFNFSCISKKLNRWFQYSNLKMLEMCLDWKGDVRKMFAASKENFSGVIRDVQIKAVGMWFM